MTGLMQVIPDSVTAMWDNFLVWVTIVVSAFGIGVSLPSGSAAVGSAVAYVVFAYIALETGHGLLTNILYVTVVLIVIGMAFKLWRLEFGGSS